MGLSQRGWARLIGAGCLGFSALAFARAEALGRWMGEPAGTVRALGARDLGSGLELVFSPQPQGALYARAMYDLADAAIFGPRAPRIVPWALGFAVLGLLAARAPE